MFGPEDGKEGRDGGGDSKVLGIGERLARFAELGRKTVDETGAVEGACSSPKALLPSSTSPSLASLMTMISC